MARRGNRRRAGARLYNMWREGAETRLLSGGAREIVGTNYGELEII